MAKLPPPEQWVLQRMTVEEVAEMIEQHIDFVDKNSRSVHLPTPFVRHYMRRPEGALPTVVAIAQLPIVLLDGTMLAPDGLDRERGIIFVISKELRNVLPRREDCTPDAIKNAMQFLTDEWLADVATNHAGKCMLIAGALTIIQRSLLPSRPVFFVTAGRRGSGKTTALTMLIVAVTGIWPAAAAWTANEDERRKALLAYYMAGVPYILWDNIPRGARITCPHIERSCTSAYYTDRKLGVSETVATAAGAVHLFTGNNIGPKGDLASRSLTVRLDVDRPDPENRHFKHPDPIGWTEDHRAEILQALYTILLGNPSLDVPRDAEMKTRYPLWYRGVGSAVEHAARLAASDGEEPVEFAKLFQAQNDEDEDDISLVEALVAMRTKWPEKFLAKDVSGAVNAISFSTDPSNLTIREFLCPTLPEGYRVSPKKIGKALSNHIGEPVRNGAETLILRRDKDRSGVSYYMVETKGAD